MAMAFFTWRTRRQTVEESLTLAVGDLRGRLTPGAYGGLAWGLGTGDESTIGYRVALEDGLLTVRLSYRWRDDSNVTIPVRMQQTRPHYGGRRWWFTCPLAIDGRRCERRVGKLHLPFGQRYFGCRKCYGLSYRSSQTAHREKRCAAYLAKTLGADLDVARRLAAEWNS